MKKTLITCLILSAAFLVMALPMQAATIWHVPADPGCGTIQAAINKTSTLPGDTIEVAAGTYAVFSLTKKLNITGAGDSTVITTVGANIGIGITDSGYGVSPTDRVTIKDMKVTGAYSGVRLDGSGPKYITLENLTAVANVYGISLNQGIVSGLTDIIVSNCRGTQNTAYGIRVSSGHYINGLTIVNCTFDNNTSAGFDIADNGTVLPVKDVTITDTTFNNNKNGIAAPRLVNATLSRVTVSGNTGTGISIGGRSANVHVHYSNLAGNGGNNLATGVPVDATLNWWGSDVAATIATKISGSATFIEFLCEPYPTTKVSVSGQCCTPTDLVPGTGCDNIDNDCDGTIDEADEDITPPEIDCNAPATITKKDASKKHPLIITPTAMDDCAGAVAADVSGLSLYKVKKNGDVKVAKCKHVSIVGDTIVITKAHKKGMFIEWTVTAKDSVGNMSTETCKTQIVKKPKKDKDDMVMTAAAEEDEEDAAEEAAEDAEELVDD